MEWKQSNKCFNIYSDINVFERAFGSRERRSVTLAFLDREVSNLYNEVGAVCSYVLRIKPDTSNNPAHANGWFFFISQMLRWAGWLCVHKYVRVCDQCCQSALLNPFVDRPWGFHFIQFLWRMSSMEFSVTVMDDKTLTVGSIYLG